MKQKLLFFLMAAALVMGFAACSEDDDANDNKVTSIIDLSTITSDLTLKDGDVVTGKLNEKVKISIADGATVTFKGDTIMGGAVFGSPCWPAVTCKGDATIELADGTTNIVRPLGSCYPGIYVPVGKTLTIRGNTGVLIVRAERAASIGGGGSIIYNNGESLFVNDNADCGNIRIEGGVIYASVGLEAACIGAGTEAKCGDITITGGKIIAQSDYGVAIGSVTGGSCGKILITGGIVEAKGLYNNDPAIGSGRYGKFESITITSGITSLKVTGGNGSTVPPIGKSLDDAGSGDVNIDGKVNPDASWTGDGMKSLKLTKPEGSNNTWQLER